MQYKTSERNLRQHRRAPLRRIRGNRFYRDKDPRESRTLCGAPCGYYDIAFGARAVAWTREDGAKIVPCSDCQAAYPAETR